MASTLITNSMNETQLSAIRARLQDIRRALDGLEAILDDVREAPASHPTLLTISEASRRLDVSRGTLYKMIRQGTIEPVAVGNTSRVRSSDLDRLLRSTA